MAVYRIEVAGPQNQGLAFAPYGGRLRGRWESSRVAHFDKSEGMKALSQIPVIPGICIELDTDKHYAKIFDPLRETPQGQVVWRQVSGVLERYQTEFGSMRELMEPKEYRDLSQDDVKTWAFEMRKALDGNLARYVEPCDRMPTADEIRFAMPGRRVRDPWNSGPQEEKLQKYTDEVMAGARRGRPPGSGKAAEEGES